MLDRMSNQSKISFLLGEGKLDRLNKEAEEIMNQDQKVVDGEDAPSLDQVAESQKQKNIDYHDMVSRGTKVMSAAGGTVTDMGGPKKFVKSEISNSIFDSEVLDRLKEVKTSREETDEEKSNINRVRNSINDEVMDSLAESLRDTDQRKGSSVSQVGEYSGSSYNKPKNGISIFDTEKDFSRVPEKTDGEKLAEKLEQERNATEDNWRYDSPTKSIKSLQDSFIDNVLKNREDAK